MATWRIAGLSVGALGLFAALNSAAAQQATAPKLTMDDLAKQLGLSADAQRQLAPELDKLNKAMAAQYDLGAKSQGVWEQMGDAFEGMDKALTPEQQWRLRMLVRLGGQPGYGPGPDNGWGYGMHMGMMGGWGAGGPGYGMMGPGFRGGSGYGMMGPGMMGGWGRGWGGSPWGSGYQSAPPR